VLEDEVLILELFAVDALSSDAAPVSKVASLTHESRDDAMERRPFVSESMLASAEFPEVFRGLGCGWVVQLELCG
jgi:hypothetical protein